MNHNVKKKSESAIPSFLGAIKFFAVVTWKIIKYTLLPLIVAYKIIRMFMSLYSILFLLMIGGGLLTIGQAPLELGAAGATGAAEATGSAAATDSVNVGINGMVEEILPY